MLDFISCTLSLPTDIIERSIRDVLVVVPDDLMPQKNGIPIPVKPYVPHISQVSMLLTFESSIANYCIF